MADERCQIPLDPMLLPYTLSPEEILKGKQVTPEQAKCNRKVVALFILKHEDRFWMRFWSSVPARPLDQDVRLGGHEYLDDDACSKVTHDHQARYSCGTTHCIAGWLETLAPNRVALFKSMQKDHFMSHERLGSALFGLTFAAARDIFYDFNHTRALDILKDWAAEPTDCDDYIREHAHEL